MLSHFLVGAARSVFTGRSVFRSGLDMFVVGLGVAIVGYYVGDLVGGYSEAECFTDKEATTKNTKHTKCISAPISTTIAVKAF